MKLIQIIKFPLSLLQVFTGTKSFADNPILGNRRLNLLGLHRARCTIAARMSAWRRRRLAARLDPLDCNNFEENGFLIKQDFLPLEQFKQLQREILDQPWETLEMQQGGTMTRRAPLDPANLAIRAPNLAKLITDKRVIDLIRYVASTGGRPIFSLQTILSNSHAEGEDPQTIPHEDTFHSAAKAWFFIHDVGPEEGPFFYVPGSHSRTKARLAWEHEQSLTAAEHPNHYHARGSFRISEEELAAIGLPKPQAITVRANTLVVADTSGFHGRTPSPQPTTRIEVYAGLRRNPFLPWLTWHIWNLPWLRSYPGTIELQAAQRLKGRGLRWLWPEGGLKPINAPQDQNLACSTTRESASN